MLMRLARAAITSFAVVLLPSACILTTDSVIAESDATFDQRLIGSWEAVGDSDRVVISRGAGNAYLLDYLDGDGEKGKFQARLGRLGSRLVLDVWPASSSIDAPVAEVELFVPQHLAMAVDIASNEVRSALFDSDSLLAAVESGRVRVSHIVSDRRVVLLGTTAELQAALGRYSATPGAFGGVTVWRRIPTKVTSADSAFSAAQSRGAAIMGVDQ